MAARIEQGGGAHPVAVPAVVAPASWIVSPLVADNELRTFGYITPHQFVLFCMDENRKYRDDNPDFKIRGFNRYLASITIYKKLPFYKRTYHIPFLLAHAFVAWYYFQNWKTKENGIGYLTIAVVLVAWLHLLTYLSTMWSKWCEQKLHYSRQGAQVLSDKTRSTSNVVGNFAYVIPKDIKVEPKLCIIKEIKVKDLELLTFEFHTQRYLCRKNYPATDYFPLLNFDAYSMYDLEVYRKRATIETEDEETLYGPNVLSVTVKTRMQLIGYQLCLPLFVFQAWNSVVFFLCHIYYMSAILVVLGLCVQTFSALQNYAKLKEQRGNDHNNSNEVLSKGKDGSPLDVIHNFFRPVSTRPSENSGILGTMLTPHKILGKDLFPGQLLRMTFTEKKFFVPADMVLVKGEVTVDESSLTGESCPVAKEPYYKVESFNRFESIANPNKPSELRHPKMSKAILYSGTKIVGIPDIGDGRFVAYGIVLRTGYRTGKGQRNYPSVERAENPKIDLDSETKMVYFSLFALAGAFIFYFAWKTIVSGVYEPYNLTLDCLFLLGTVCPIDLPLQYLITLQGSVKSLQDKHRITCTKDTAAPDAGEADIALFDKTGTITNNVLIFLGVGDLHGDITPADTLKVATPRDENIFLFKPAIAAAHESTLDNDGRHWRTNNEEDEALAEYMEFTPEKHHNRTCSKFADGTIVERHAYVPYSSQAACMRTACNARYSDGTTHNMICIKGGHTQIIERINFAGKEREQYEQRGNYFASQGYRVLALATYMDFHDTEFAIILSNFEIQVQELERQRKFRFLGFLLFNSNPKDDSLFAIDHLRDSGHAVAMLTGDNELTGSFVARQVGIFRKSYYMTLDLSKWEKKGDTVTTFLVSNLEKDTEIRSEGIDLDPTELSSFTIPEYIGFNTANELSPYIKHAPPPHPYSPGARLIDCVDICVKGNINPLVYKYHEDIRKTFLQRCMNMFKCLPERRPFLHYVQVFSKAKPDDKTAVVKCMQDIGFKTMMVGDGANDMGALGIADTSVAVCTRYEDKDDENDDDTTLKWCIFCCDMTSCVNCCTKCCAGCDKCTGAFTDKDEKSHHDAVRKVIKDNQKCVGDANSAAYFTTPSSLMNVAHIVAEGRASGAGKAQLFRVVIMTSFVVGLAMSMLASAGCIPGDMQNLVFTLPPLVVRAFMTYNTASRQVSKERPAIGLSRAYTVFSLLFQVALHGYCLVYLLNLTTPFAIPMLPEEMSARNGKFHPSVGNTVLLLGLQWCQVSLLVTNYIGQPFKLSLMERPDALILLLMFVIGILLPSTIQWYPFGMFQKWSAFVGFVPIPKEIQYTFYRILVADFLLAYIIEWGFLVFLADFDVKKLLKDVVNTKYDNSELRARRLFGNFKSFKEAKEENDVDDLVKEAMRPFARGAGGSVEEEEICRREIVKDPRTEAGVPPTMGPHRPPGPDSGMGSGGHPAPPIAGAGGRVPRSTFSSSPESRSPAAPPAPPASPPAETGGLSTSGDIPYSTPPPITPDPSHHHVDVPFPTPLAATHTPPADPEGGNAAV